MTYVLTFPNSKKNVFPFTCLDSYHRCALRLQMSVSVLEHSWVILIQCDEFVMYIKFKMMLVLSNPLLKEYGYVYCFSESCLLKPCEAHLCGTMALRHFLYWNSQHPLFSLINILFDKYVRTSANITKEKNKYL